MDQMKVFLENQPSLIFSLPSFQAIPVTLKLLFSFLSPYLHSKMNHREFTQHFFVQSGNHL
jgi:hypothetical protein